MQEIDIKKIRIEMKLSQKIIANLFGMQQQHYSRLETGYEGRKPTKQHIALINMLKFIHDNNLLLKYMTTNKTLNLT